jgi:rfaE bifunctional protein nucleotidyltransferase chain/domain/rfaE bifunctional protein kinase chain/domain
MRGRLLVVGDALLDRDIEGSSERLCPDAPVPVLDQHEARLRPGGAGLAALLAAGGGRPVTLVTALGQDPAAAELATALLGGGVDLVDLGLDGPTPEKVRMLDRGRPLMRLDRGGAAVRIRAGDGAALRGPLSEAAGVLVSDYGRGLLAEPAVRAALSSRPPAVPLVWDPHPRGAAPLAGATLATPNFAEAARFVGFEPGWEEPELSGLMRRLLSSWKVGALCLTRGGAGAVLATPYGEPRAFTCRPASGDPCGAGDRFAASAAWALADGMSCERAVEAAVEAAREFVAAGGASGAARPARGPAAGTELDRAELGAAPLSIEPALALAERVRRQGGTVVATGGCFDLLHVGHVRTLEAARRLGDCLVVLLNGDRSVRRLKGSDRPLVGELERAAMLSALACVDEVAIFDELDPSQALSVLRPDVWAKGGDYEAGELPESEAIASWGGRTAILPYLAGRSTTRLIEEVGERVER